MENRETPGQEDRQDIILKAVDLKKYFAVRNFLGTSKHYVKAVDGVNLEIARGECFGLVGESGCGKSTLGRTLIRMYEPTGGQILFDGDDITSKKKKELLPYHKRMQIIFQDPYSALDPHQNVREIMSEPLRMSNPSMSRQESNDKIMEILEKVGLQKDALEKYAYEFSGGQRQRIGIARALAVNPEFIMCDEPISALDVSIQAQVVNMLEDLQHEFGLTYLFVSHDLSMVRHISDRIGVMYLGNIVEIAQKDELYDNPLHPYTQALLSAIPIADPERAKASRRKTIEGDLPSPMDIPSGCRFHTRCPYATEQCRGEDPQLRDFDGHQVACHRAGEI
ncbi:MAG: ABC transporter ATP-binding protein [Lachnospiraceae bacterium]|nr:ABC transporter ATP-binding protein [Lachnospiraceae bacterium]